ncbi:MAG: sensor histidine kinase [Syntrophomonadaceae bacterium]|nr:sensor histidine kinase [Syntrophomonadaceae bacterium]
MPDKIKMQRRFSRVLHKHKLLSILVAALLTVISMMALVRLPETPEAAALTEQNGLYDLSGIADLAGTQLLLTPTETYYPNTYLTPETANTAVPESTRRYDEIRADYLSQRFVVLLPDDGVYDMTFRLSGRHAMRVYVNGELIGETGRLGTNKQDTEVWENNLTVSAAPKDGKMDIILQSAQFYHAKRGASLAKLNIGRQGMATAPFASDRTKGLLVMGGLLSAAVSLLGIYLMLARTKATLYFALACVAMALREAIQSQAWTYFPLSGNVSFLLEYFSVVLLTVFLTLYLGQYADNRLLKSTRLLALAGSTLYGLCVLFGDSLFYTSVLTFYQVLLLLCIVPSVAGLFYKMRSPNREQAAALYGIAVFFLSAVADIFMYLDVFGETETNLPVSEACMLIFAVAQAFSLYMMNNRVLMETKEAEQKLTIEKAALEELNRLKTEFLGNASHELKTPLTVISGYAQTVKHLSEKTAPLNGSEVSRRMTLISSEAERLSLMVSQVLDVTRMEEGRMVMEPVRCYAEESIHAAVRTHYPILNKNRNRLDIRIESGLPAVYADPVRLSQVIVNLISNAVRFTADGVITISAKRKDSGVLICVSDTGCGIEAERMPRVFERYGKKQKTGGGQDTGTGLGLYICKHIVEQHGGAIWLESEEGRGTSVCFTLPGRTNTAPC